MKKTINIALTNEELAAIISALDFTLISGTDEQFTEDGALLNEIYDALDAFDNDTGEIFPFTKTLALRLAVEFTKEADE